MSVSVEQIINSASWAAYGDALGFITELADASGVKKRAGADVIKKLIPWRRLVGGKFGAFAQLPEGCYSDDTQLRLSTCRAIRGSGEFDVEAFAKVEVPVWLSYALGAGRGTKIAAASLAKDNINWFSNFFDGTSGRYVDTGGNGAAMRIQPHVWAARDNSFSYLRDVIRNAICTHGHARGFLGAVFHAASLLQALETRRLPGPDEWEKAVKVFGFVPDIVQSDSSLSNFWLPTWERLSQESLGDAVKRVQLECIRDIELVSSISTDNDLPFVYRELATRLGVLEDSQRGSGTKTAILGSVLPWLFRFDSPERALLTSANLLGSDTDTIATMAGAIVGAVSQEAPPERVADYDYLEAEARRMHAIRVGSGSSSFPYPDLLKWQPPRTQLDTVGKEGESFYVAGLGKALPAGPEIPGRAGDDMVWQWLELSFGQSVLVKRRRGLRPVVAENTLQQTRIASREVSNNSSRQNSLFHPPAPASGTGQSIEPPRTLDSMSSEAIKSGFDPKVIGLHLLELADRKDGIELAIGYSAIIAKARSARNSRRS